jgi:hypothetical protein
MYSQGSLAMVDRGGGSVSRERAVRVVGIAGAVIAATVLVAAPAAGQSGTPPAVSWSPDGVDFGAVDVGTTASRVLTLINSGGSGVGAINVALSGSSAFSIVADSCTGNALGPGKACAVTVEFAPTTAGQSDAASLIASAKRPGVATASAQLAGAAANAAPAVTVDVPVEGGLFGFGDRIPFSVTVTDPEDGVIDCSRVSVTFVLAHDLHGHAQEAVNGCTGNLPTIVDDVAHGGNVWGVVSASYTDLGGLTTVAQANIRQKLQQVEFALNQSGTNTANTSDIGGGQHRGSLGAGDWIELNGPFNLVNIDSLTFRLADAVAGRTPGSPLMAVEVRQDAPDGPIVTVANLTSTGATTSWQSQTFPLPDPGGTSRLFLVIQSVTDGATGADTFNLNWVVFEGQGVGRH